MQINISWFLKDFWKQLLSCNCRQLYALLPPYFVCNNVEHFLKLFKRILCTNLHSIKYFRHINEYNCHALSNTFNKEIVQLMELWRKIVTHQAAVQDTMQFMEVRIFWFVEPYYLVEGWGFWGLTFHFVEVKVAQHEAGPVDSCLPPRHREHHHFDPIYCFFRYFLCADVWNLIL